MRIDKELVTEFEKRGYILRPTFWDEEEERKRLYKKSRDYNAMFCTGENRRLNYGDMTDEEIEARHHKQAVEFTNWAINSWWSDSTSLFIFHDNAIWEMKNLGKYKAVTEEQITRFIAKQEKAYATPYGAFVKKMQSLLSQEQISGRFSIYPTTYGIGVWLFYNFHAEENVSTVENLLKERGVDYYNEFSEANWVFRFKISKKAANLAKIA